MPMDTYDQVLQSLSLDAEGISRQFMSFSAFFNIMAAALMGFLVLAIYLSSSGREKRDRNLYLVIPVLTVLMAVMMRVTGPQVVSFFGIFGIMSVIRFRSDITDQKGITFILFAVIEGVIIGVNAYLLAVLAWVVVSVAILVGRYLFHHRVTYRLSLRYPALPPPEAKAGVMAWFTSRGIAVSFTGYSATSDFSEKSQAWTEGAKAEFMVFPVREEALTALIPAFLAEMREATVEAEFRRHDMG